VDKHNPSAAWKAFRKQLSRLLKDALRLSKMRSHMDVQRYDVRRTRLSDRLEQLLSITPKDRDVLRLIKRLRRHKQELFTFLDYPDVSPYNNHAEQQ